MLLPERVLLQGRAGEDRVDVSVAYAALVEVRVGRSGEERLNGRPALVLVPRNGAPILVQPLGLGLLHELTGLLAELAKAHADGTEQVAVIVPLKPGCFERAKDLVAKGPPFDPALLDLQRHRVYISDRQVVFVFDGPNARAQLEHLTHNPTLWRAGLAWTACIAGRPRLSTTAKALNGDGSEPVYSWAADDNRP